MLIIKSQYQISSSVLKWTKSIVDFCKWRIEKKCLWSGPLLLLQDWSSRELHICFNLVSVISRLDKLSFVFEISMRVWGNFWNDQCNLTNILCQWNIVLCSPTGLFKASSLYFRIFKLDETSPMMQLSKNDMQCIKFSFCIHRLFSSLFENITWLSGFNHCF